MPVKKEDKKKNEKPEVKTQELTALNFKPDAKWLKNMKAVLSAHPYVKTIFINDIGAYHFNEIEGFTAIDSEDIMKATIAEAPPAATGGEGGKKEEMQF